MAGARLGASTSTRSLAEGAIRTSPDGASTLVIGRGAEVAAVKVCNAAFLNACTVYNIRHCHSYIIRRT